MIKPLPGYILVEPIKEETQSGGIYLPQDLNDKPSKGKVVAIGYWTKDWKEQWAEIENFEIGQTILFKKWTNQEVKYEGKEYLLVKFDELLAIIE